MSGKFEKWGPYLSFGADPATSMTISWKDEGSPAGAWVEYGETELCEITVKETGGTLGKVHSITLEGLEPSTTYYYQVSRDPGDTHHFTTGPPRGSTGPFEFTVNGDMHAYPCNNLKRYFDLMLELAPEHEFYVGVGDFINDGENMAHWNAYFHDASEYLKVKPQVNATGNHETNNPRKYKNYLDAFHHPYVDPKMGGYYLMEYANAVLFFIDSDNAGHWAPTPSDAQYEWLEENLEKHARKDKWIFLFMHHQVYSTGDFGCEPLMAEVFRPLCQEYHVDAVFYGHDHHYECFWVDRDADWGGTLYFVSGGGGGQHHIDYSIMGDRDGRTIYVWPGRFLNVRKHGVPPLTPNAIERAKHCRNDEVVGNCQLLGVLEPNFVHVRVDGDEMELKCIGWQKQVYHHLKVKRTGKGRKFSKGAELALLDY